jgi:hypothetical protein
MLWVAASVYGFCENFVFEAWKLLALYKLLMRSKAFFSILSFFVLTSRSVQLTNHRPNPNGQCEEHRCPCFNAPINLNETSWQYLWPTIWFIGALYSTCVLPTLPFHHHVPDLQIPRWRWWPFDTAVSDEKAPSALKGRGAAPGSSWRKA